MRRFAWFALFAAFAFGQSNDPFKPKPPAGVDAALRARVAEFFDLHVKGQFRKAEELVAADTKDFFYTGNKPRYLSFEILRIDYSANFTKATVVTMCEQTIIIPGYSGQKKVPTPSTWKLEHGKWYWYVDQDALRNTPWGRMTAGVSPAKGAPPAPSLPTIPGSADFVAKLVQMDKTAVRLKAGESADVTIANGAPGEVTLSVPTDLPGVEAKLDKSSLSAGAKTTLTVHAARGAKSGVLSVKVEPTMQLLELQVTIEPAVPPSFSTLPPTTDPPAKPIQMDKTAVRLKAGESADVTITNGAPSEVALSVPAALPGLETKLDKPSLPAGGKAILTLHAAKGAKSGILSVKVEPTMQVLPLQVTIVD